jgi:hypothetical protein
MAKVYVGNLPATIPESTVEREFERFGRCRVWVARKPPGFGELQGLCYSCSPCRQNCLAWLLQHRRRHCSLDRAAALVSKFVQVEQISAPRSLTLTVGTIGTCGRSDALEVHSCMFAPAVVPVVHYCPSI